MARPTWRHVVGPLLSGITGTCGFLILYQYSLFTEGAAHTKFLALSIVAGAAGVLSLVLALVAAIRRSVTAPETEGS